MDDEDERKRFLSEIKEACKEAGMEDELLSSMEKVLIKDPENAFTPDDDAALEDWEDHYHCHLEDLHQAILEGSDYEAAAQGVRARYEELKGNYQSCIEHYNKAEGDKKGASGAVANAEVDLDALKKDLGRAKADRDAKKFAPVENPSAP